MTTYQNPMTVYICDDYRKQLEDLHKTLASVSRDLSIETKLFTSPADLMSGL